MDESCFAGLMNLFVCSIESSETNILYDGTLEQASFLWDDANGLTQAV